MKRVCGVILCGLAAWLSGCKRPVPAVTPTGTTANLAKRFEERLSTPGTMTEAEALAFVRVLGPAAAPILGNPRNSTGASQHRFLARLIVAAAQAGIRNQETFAAAARYSSDPDEATRWAARDALLWSRVDWDPALGAWLRKDEIGLSREVDREYPLPLVEDALASIRRDISESGTDPRILSRTYDRMPLVQGKIDVNAYEKLPIGDLEKLFWLIQCARAGEAAAITRLGDYLEQEPSSKLGRVPTETERKLAAWGLQSSQKEFPRR